MSISFTAAPPCRLDIPQGKVCFLPARSGRWGYVELTCVWRPFVDRLWWNFRLLSIMLVFVFDRVEGTFLPFVEAAPARLPEQ